MNFFFLVSVAGILLCVSSCSTSIPKPTDDDIQKNNQSPSLHIALQGRERYIQYCSGCHSVPSPQKYTKSEWEKIFPEMSKKAKIDDNTQQIILTYIMMYTKKTSALFTE